LGQFWDDFWLGFFIIVSVGISRFLGLREMFCKEFLILKMLFWLEIFISELGVRVKFYDLFMDINVIYQSYC
jgi:hypothetical protein